MSYREEMLEMLSKAGEMLVEKMSPQEARESNLLEAWLQQVASALKAVRMDEELALWEQVRHVTVKVDSEAGFTVYVTSMRAILLGFLSRIENQ